MQPFGRNRHGPKIGGSAPFWGGLGPHLTQSPPGLRPTSISSGILMSSCLVTIEMGRKLGRGSAPFLGKGDGSSSDTKSPELSPTSIPSGILMHPGRLRPIFGEGAYLHTKYHLDPSSRLATMNVGRKLGWGYRPSFGRGRWAPI